jgi:hypothetical protein
VYWSITTLTTVGYGDITPVTELETLYTIIVMIRGVTMYAYIIGNIASIIAGINAAKAVFQQRVDGVREFMLYHRLPDTISCAGQFWRKTVFRTTTISCIESGWFFQKY